jgi:hypothetical protein
MLPNSAFIGMMMGAIMTSWANWMHSAQPDQYDGNHVLFLRTNVGMAGSLSLYHNRSGDMGMNVDPNTGVLIFTAEYHIGSYYKGTKMESK